MKMESGSSVDPRDQKKQSVLGKLVERFLMPCCIFTSSGNNKASMLAKQEKTIQPKQKGSMR